MTKRKKISNKQSKIKQNLEEELWDEEETGNEEDLEEDTWEEETEDEEDSAEEAWDEEIEDEEDIAEDSWEEETEDEEGSTEESWEEESTEIENSQDKKNKKYKHKKSKLGKETKKHKADELEAESVVVKKKKTKNQVSEIMRETMQDFDSTRYKPLNIETHTRSVGKAGAASIINSPKNGKRFTISKKTMDEIGNPKAIKIAVSKNKIAISAAEEDSPEALKLGRIGAKGVIYSAELVKELTEKYNLDFSSRVSITFDKVEYTADGDQIVAEITMR